MKKIVLMMLILTMAVSIAACGLSECAHSNTTQATCEEEEKCNDCGEILGEAQGHNWELATCSTPKTCSVCGATEGSANGHTWKAATCSTPKTCVRCNQITGGVVAHKYNNGYCEYCKGKDPYYLDITSNNVLNIQDLFFSINSAGGVEMDITFKNTSSKQIAYIYLTVKFYDRMGKPAYCEIRDSHTRNLKYTGPLNSGSVKTASWDPIIYNASTAAVRPLTITIEYTDGTKISITSNGTYWTSSKYYGGSLKD